MLILILEDLMANPEQEVNKVFNFLGVESFKLDSYDIVGKGKYTRGSIKPEAAQWLYKHYEPYNKRLEEFLGRSLPWRA